MSRHDYVYSSFQFSVEGVNFRADLVADECSGSPWENSDCYGVVIDGWLLRDKYPCERILVQDRGCKRFYDHQASVIKFRSQGCTAKEAHKQALRDFERLRGWCNDQWFYAGVVVTLLDDFGDEISDCSDSLWGIESDCSEYHREVASELAGGLLAGLVAGVCHAS